MLIVCSTSTYYEVLGVPRNASRLEIRNAYYKVFCRNSMYVYLFNVAQQRAKALHPDARGATDAHIDEGFVQVSLAYEILGNSSSRARYDDQLSR